VNAMIPATMKAIQIQAYDGRLQLVQKPVPQPGAGQALVRIAASPINPSDLKFIQGVYGVRKPLPVVPGFEGSGVVVAAGPGLMGKFLMGKRVACMAPESGDGTWAEYMLADARKCIPLRKSVTLEQGATMIVNPWTAWALLDTARRGRHKAAVHTAASSALGRMLVALGLHQNYPIIHVVRRPAQADMLRKLGAQHVLNSSEADFDGWLRDLCHQLGATIAFDPVAGEMTGRVLAAMPDGSRALVYGSLSDAACTVRPEQLIYEGKTVEGFWVPKWVAKLSLLRRARMAFKVQGLLGEDFRTEVRARMPLEQANEALEAYKGDMTSGKVLLMPGGAV
jgi:NADPH:quinone reductase